MTGHHMIRVYSRVPKGSVLADESRYAASAIEFDTLNVLVGKFVTFIPATYGVLYLPGKTFDTNMLSHAERICFVFDF